jgi:hypothetical protein
VVDDAEFEFSPGEVNALNELRGTLRQVAEWPPESPLSFVLMLAPRTRGCDARREHDDHTATADERPGRPARCAPTDLMRVTPEEAPLALFGPAASEFVADLLARYGIELLAVLSIG